MLDVPVTGLYCLAVWKAGIADLPKNGRFELEFVAGVTSVPESAPTMSRLTEVRPNPFNPSTTVVFAVGRAGRVQVSIYDLAGRRVRSLLDDALSPGRRTVAWDGSDDRGQRVPSGVYLVRLVAPDASDRRTVTLVK